MGLGRYVTVIGAIIGILTVGISLVLPELLAWWRLEVVNGGIIDGYYLTGLGGVVIRGTLIERDASIPGLIGGIAVIVGAILCIICAITELKTLGFFGGILMLTGPVLLYIDFLVRLSDLARAIGIFVDGIGGGSLFWNSYDDGFYVYTWGLWIGFFAAAVGGFLGLLGGVAV